MNNSLLDTAVVPIQKLENAKPSNAMINMGQSKPTYFSYGGSVAPPEVQLAEPPPINLAFGGVPNVPVVPVAKTVEATTYSGDTVGEGIANFADNKLMDKYLDLSPMQKMDMLEYFEKLDQMYIIPQEERKRRLEDDPLFQQLQEMQKQMQTEQYQANMSPEMNMIYKAQMDNTGLIKLMNMDYRERI
jgi:hypothetical protein